MKLGKSEIQNFLPHRDPFLFLDEVQIVDKTNLEGSFTPLEEMIILSGHFPKNPIVPGVILIESLAQLACFIGYGQSSTPLNFYLVGVDGFKFKKIIKPNDSLVLKVKLENSKLSLFYFSGVILLNNEKVCEGKLWGTMTKRE